IRQVTNIARRMVTQFGMSQLGMVDYSNGGDQPFIGYSLGQGRQYSEETAARIDSEVRKIIDDAYTDTRNLLSSNRDKLDEIAQELLNHEVVERERILEIMDMPPDKPLDEPEAVLSDAIDEVIEELPEADDPFAMFTEDEPDHKGDVDATEPDTKLPPQSPDGEQPDQNQ